MAIEKTYLAEKGIQLEIKTGVENVQATLDAGVGKVLKIKTFNTPGTHTWTVPTGVTEIYVTGGGGGGGGAGSHATSNGSSGGATSFGNLLTLSGGGGASASATEPGGAPGGLGGIAGDPPNPTIPTKGGDSGFYRGGAGGAKLSNAETYSSRNGNTGSYCSGGGGASSNSCSGGGGGAHFVIDHQLTVTPGTTYTITIGAGGAGGPSINGVPSGGKGGNGILFVKWWE